MATEFIEEGLPKIEQDFINSELEKLLQESDTHDYQAIAKVTIPKEYKVVNQIIWKPIKSDTIKVQTRNSPTENWTEEIQVQRKYNSKIDGINREYIKEVMDLDQFVWEDRTLPEGINSMLPELYDQLITIPELENNKVQWWEYPLSKVSLAAQKIKGIKAIEKQKKYDSPEPPQLNANNHLQIKLFRQADVLDTNYNKFTQPQYTSSEKQNNDLVDLNKHWIAVGIFEDVKRIEQIFNSFPAIDRDYFGNYKEICKEIDELRALRNDKLNKSKKLALAYEMVLIANRSLPNKLVFVTEETESPDIGKLTQKDA